ncbi:MAG: bifunctional riboflavin kinase/FAD synthetase [Vicinamibacteria bacterium]|nr:bifunctional riboflavin kinase/FAD synthetase [Vicinamibacteria bacterium]
MQWLGPGAASAADRPAALAVGNFDGVHRGHQELVRRALAAAAELGLAPAALTFEPHPSRVLAPDRAPAALMTLAQKVEALTRLGLPRVAVLPFDAALAALEAEAFANDLLAGRLRARAVIVGTGFRFGRGRLGDVATLQRLGRAAGFEVRAVDHVADEGMPISSTRVREAVVRGAVDAAARLLGRPLFIDGEVVRGDGRARGLGYPTANIQPFNELLPGNGVYAVWVRLPGVGVVPGVANIGRRPTFGGNEVRLEAHLFDLDADLYGEQARVAFVVRLREERRFAGPEALQAQIAADAAEARRVLGGAAAPAL